MATKKDEMTQLVLSTPPRSPTMVGRAVAKMVWPSELISMVSMRPEKTVSTSRVL